MTAPGLTPASKRCDRSTASVLQSCMREGPLQIIEPPFMAAERSTVDDPDLTVSVPRSGR